MAKKNFLESIGFNRASNVFGSVSGNVGNINVYNGDVNNGCSVSSENESSGSAAGSGLETVQDVKCQSKVYLANKKGAKIDTVRVLNSLHELGFFVDSDGNKLDKKVFFEEVSKMLNCDFSDFSQLMYSAISASSSPNCHLNIFERMREKMIEALSKNGIR